MPLWGFGGLTVVQKYDPETDTWATLADMPFEGFAISASVVDGKVYIIGGSEKAYPFRPPHRLTV
jgi:N-acetylneuraminic acid mutarotase